VPFIVEMVESVLEFAGVSPVELRSDDNNRAARADESAPVTDGLGRVVGEFFDERWHLGMEKGAEGLRRCDGIDDDDFDLVRDVLLEKSRDPFGNSHGVTTLASASKDDADALRGSSSGG